MKYNFCASTTCLLLTFYAAGILAEDAATPVEKESVHLKNIRRLTFAGSKNGEAYYSAQGDQIVFQGVREPENPFYQIYTMDLARGKTRRVSTGMGKTTCAFFRPDGKRILFASTHLDPETQDKQKREIETLKSPQRRRYGWDFDPNFDIFESDPDGGNLVRLTDAKGYDAEGSYSPDGKSIVFCSMRDDDGEIYVMDSDGKNQRRLTHEKGYDGGPFFSPDGKKIVWRHFEDEAQKTAELWIMDADGSNKKQITHLNAVTWAPYFHPSMKWIVFASNYEDPAFEVYAVRPDGSEITRLTYTPGFDGLPVISPDGSQLLWTSNRAENKSHIFVAELVLPGEKEPALRVRKDLTAEAAKEQMGEILDRARSLSQAAQEFRIEHEVARQYHLSGLTPFGVFDKIDETAFVYGPRITGWIPPHGGSNDLIATLAGMQSAQWTPAGVAAQAETIKLQTTRKRKEKELQPASGLYFTTANSDDLDSVSKFIESDTKKQEGVKTSLFVSLVSLLNQDGAGSAFELTGAGSSPGFRELAERLAALHPELSIEIEDSPESTPELRQFIDKSIPAISLRAGGNAKWRVEEGAFGHSEALLISVCMTAVDALNLLASGEIKMPFTAYDPVAARAAADAAKRPFLGTVPEYKGDGTGVKLTRVLDGSPAQAAGLKANDVIVELGGTKIKDVNEYLQALESAKVGVKIGMKFMRDGKEESVEITPTTR